MKKIFSEQTDRDYQDDKNTVLNVCLLCEKVYIGNVERTLCKKCEKDKKDD
jgi:hypothetical protein